MLPILCLWIKVLSIVLRSTITFSFSHIRKKFCSLYVIEMQTTYNFSATKYNKEVLTLHLPSYPLLLGRHLLHFEPFNGIKSNLRRIKSIQTHPGDEDRHHGKQIRGTNASKSGEPIQIRGETNWYKQLSFDFLTQEHKDNTFWSIKQFFCHDMFSQRFSFPSWCFSLVMGKWFKGKSLGQSRGWHDRRGVGSCLGKTQQKAADCLKLLREAQTTSNIARLNILSSTEIFLWLGWNPFQSCACDMRGGELSMPCHLSSSCPRG